MIYTIHGRIDGEVKTTTIHSRPEKIQEVGHLLKQTHRHADIYIGEDCIVVKERVA